MPSCQVDLGAVAVGPDRADAGAGDDLGAGGGGAAGQGVGDRAHAADRHPPLAGAVADQVVEEAAVLDQRRVVQRREGADQRVGADHAADGVVGEAALDRRAERLGHEVAPDARVDLRRAGRARWGSGSGQRRGDGVRQVGDLGVELAPGVVLRVAAGELGERRPGRPPSGRSTSSPPWRPSRTQGVYDAVVREARRDVEVEVGHQRLGHQADQVGVAREPRRLAGERARPRPRRRPCGRAARGPAPTARPGRGRRRRRARCARPDDHDVIAGLRRSHPTNLVPTVPGDRQPGALPSPSEVGRVVAQRRAGAGLYAVRGPARRRRGLAGHHVGESVPVGLAAGALVLASRRAWWVYVPLIGLASAAAYSLAGASAAVAVVWGVAMAAGATVSAAVQTRRTPPRRATRRSAASTTTAPSWRRGCSAPRPRPSSSRSPPRCCWTTTPC